MTTRMTKKQSEMARELLTRARAKALVKRNEVVLKSSYISDQKQGVQRPYVCCVYLKREPIGAYFVDALDTKEARAIVLDHLNLTNKRNIGVQTLVDFVDYDSPSRLNDNLLLQSGGLIAGRTVNNRLKSLSDSEKGSNAKINYFLEMARDARVFSNMTISIDLTTQTSKRGKCLAEPRPYQEVDKYIIDKKGNLVPHYESVDLFTLDRISEKLSHNFQDLMGSAYLGIAMGLSEYLNEILTAKDNLEYFFALEKIYKAGYSVVNSDLRDNGYAGDKKQPDYTYGTYENLSFRELFIDEEPIPDELISDEVIENFAIDIMGKSVDELNSEEFNKFTSMLQEAEDCVKAIRDRKWRIAYNLLSEELLPLVRQVLENYDMSQRSLAEMLNSSKTTVCDTKKYIRELAFELFPNGEKSVLEIKVSYK